LAGEGIQNLIITEAKLGGVTVALGDRVEPTVVTIEDDSEVLVIIFDGKDIITVVTVDAIIGEC